MTSIAIISDSDTSLPQDSLIEHKILQVPITIHFGEEILEACSGITDSQLVERVNRDGVLPTTSAPSPGAFAEAFKEAFEGGAGEILCLTVSAGVSATYQAAISAKELFPDRKITVLDTQTISMGQGFMVLEAARLAHAGMSSSEIIDSVEKVRDRTHLFAALDTLKFMAMSGRVGNLTSEMANLLNIKPILSIMDGKLDLLEKVRTRKKAWSRVYDLAAEHLGKGQIENIYILHVAAEQAAGEFEKGLREVIPCPEFIPKTGLTPGLSVHTGGGLVGVAFTTKE